MPLNNDLRPLGNTLDSGPPALPSSTRLEQQSGLIMDADANRNRSKPPDCSLFASSLFASHAILNGKLLRHRLALTHRKIQQSAEPNSVLTAAARRRFFRWGDVYAV